ncbi:aldo/keto reductase [Magnetococcus sp. PR-3]|uniref:aldo/keto reductase n=1 Tax=Magnetococcus sp. PR-3 TaxID=3120355 RepID=UPI002FCE3769
MEYRRFGKTEKQVSVFTMGGMRFVQGWDEPHDQLPQASLDHCHEMLQTVLDGGVNLIETAKGYGKSERLIGQTLPKLRQTRDQYMIMSKASPTETAAEMRTHVENALQFMGIDHMEFFALHGVNTQALLDMSLRPGGPFSALQAMKKEGKIGHIGFATHAPLPVILQAIQTDCFEFINLHYYFFRQGNRAAIDAAAAKDMGIFIISPQDKGGMLYTPPARLAQQSQPLPIANYNERWILSHPHIHTMTVGMSEPNHLDLHLHSLAMGKPYWGKEERQVEIQLKEAAAPTLLDRCGICTQCLPCPERIEMPDLLRLEHLALAHDMTPFAQYRYGLMEPQSHWVPGAKGDTCSDCGDCLPRCPQQLDIPKLVRQAHARMHLPPS